LQSVPLTELALDGIEVRRVTPPTVHAKFDLTLMLRPAEGGMTASWEYCADLFDGSTIERMATHFETMLRAVVTDPRQPIGRIPMLSAHERASLLAWSGAPVGDPPPACVHELFEAQAAATPDAIAIADAGATLTYRQLNARANRLAHYLRAQGVERGQRVGVCLERSSALIFTLLAILKSGAAYVPLDPDVPADRLAFMLDDAGASTVVMRETLSAGLAHAPCRVLRLDVERAAIAEQPADDESLRTQPSDLACVMYTSGSTGAPKGVAVPHRAIVRLVRATDYMQLGAGDVVAQLSNPAFDAATFEIWGALLNGARIELIPRDTMLAPRALADALKRHSVTTVFLTTALFNQLAREAPAAFSACRDVLFGGEAVDPKAVAAILRDEPPQRLLHVYGPTETTTFATWHLVTAVEDAARTVPIGGPIGYTEVYVLDRYGEPVPIGVAGEIHIGGPGLALGYLGQPQLTAERFIPHPFTSSGARLYRTGDRARYRPDGAIEFLGRLDRQVKIRGHRVEPGEVEAALLRLPDVREAVVIVRGDSAEARQMIAYVASATGAHPAPAQLMSELRRSLPQYMLPSAIVVLDALPLNRHGKVDRRALPDPSDIAEGRTGAHAPPRDPLEHMLAGIWEELLGVRNVGVNDSFFDLGGHSLLAAQMMDAVERACGRSVPLTILFGAATIAELSRALAGKTEASREPVIAVNGDGGRPPFFFLHGDYSGGGFYSRELSRALGADQPFYAVHPHGLIDAQVPDSIEAMAADRLRAVRAVQPNGPYALGGHCNGALVAFEMARLLVEQGEEVPVVIVLDAKAPWRSVRVFPGISLGEEREKSPRAIQGADVPVASPPDTTLLYRRAIAAYMPRRYPGRLVVLRSQANQDLRESLGWSGMASVIETYAIPGNHHTSITRHVAETGARIRSCLDEAFSERPVQAQVQIR
jgi:amino acid adenylation domain-containing protein